MNIYIIYREHGKKTYSKESQMIHMQLIFQNSSPAHLFPSPPFPFSNSPQDFHTFCMFSLQFGMQVTEESCKTAEI